MKSVIALICAVSCFAGRAQEFKTYDENIPGSTVTFRMVAVKGGDFLIGSPATEKTRDADEGPQVKIQVSPFWMAEHEVTFEEWDVFFKDLEIPQTKAIAVDAISRPTAQYIDLTWGMGRDAKQPTNSMSHQAAMMYCKWLFDKTGVFYRLPTEAEWEYACKANTSATPVKPNGYFKDNSGGKFQKVKSLKPNAFGLFDMLGNLSEWTLDQYDPEAYKKLGANAKDPLTPPGAKHPKVVKGGSFTDDAKALRCSNRIASEASWNKRDPQVPKSRWWLTDGMFVGFRVVRPATAPTKEEAEKFYSNYLK